MKNLKIAILFIFLGGIFMVASCGTKAEAAATGLEYTGAYVCPMHCTGSGSQTAGTCPICNMDYEPLAQHKADGHTHKAEAKVEENHDGHDHDGHDHSGHDHDDHSGHNH